MITLDEVSAAVNYLRDTSSKAAKARAEAQYLDEYSKSLKSIIMLEKEGSVASREMEALADPRYKTHLEAVKIATEHDLYLRHMLHAADVKISVWQSEGANERSLGKV